MRRIFDRSAIGEYLFDNLTDMRAPQVQGCPTLCQKFVPLIYGRSTRNRAGLVIKDLIRNMRRNAQAGHARDAGPAQVMQAPPGHPRAPVEQTFGATKISERLASERREDQRPAPVGTLQHSRRLVGEVHDVRLRILSP